MEIITSRQNQLIKRLARLASSSGARQDEGVLFAEGFHLLQEALRSGLSLRLLVVSESALLLPHLRALVESSSTVERIHVSDECYRKFTALRSPEGIAFLAEPGKTEREELFFRGARLVVLDGIQDPGNAGTILRTAEAAGMTGAVFLNFAVDPTHPALLRASMGASFRLPAASLDVDEFLEHLESVEISLAVACGSGGVDYRTVDYSPPFALVIGSEGMGVSSRLRSHAKLSLSIPMAGLTESLNAAVAAGLLMFESLRSPRLR